MELHQRQQLVRSLVAVTVLPGRARERLVIERRGVDGAPGGEEPAEVLSYP